jgi:hypothetical protein
MIDAAINAAMDEIVETTGKSHEWWSRKLRCRTMKARRRCVSSDKLFLLNFMDPLSAIAGNNLGAACNISSLAVNTCYPGCSRTFPGT